MQRYLTTYPLSKNSLLKLNSSGFISVEDLVGIKPNELSSGTGLTLEEVSNVLEVVFPSSTSNLFENNALDVLNDEKSCLPISTSCHALDNILNGGIPKKKITELCGLPGAGKTQMCLQLCVNVQIPKSLGGEDGEALFIDTEGSFFVQRLAQIGSALIEDCQKESVESAMAEFTLEKILKGVHYCCCKSYLELVARMHLLHDFLTANEKISLIVVDSIAFHFRYGFDGSFSLRSKLLNGILQTLVKVANEHKVTVVVTNQMTSRAAGPTPALGESWGHACAVRCVLSWSGNMRQARVLKSPTVADAECFYTITKSGIRDV